MNQSIYLIGLNHRTAGVEIRESYALAECDACTMGLVAPEGPLIEAVTLSTCNRVEALVTTSAKEEAVRQIVAFLAEMNGIPAADFEDKLYRHVND